MWARSYWICTKICFSYKEGVDKKLQEFEAEMEQKRQKVENSFNIYGYFVIKKKRKWFCWLLFMYMYS